MQPSAVAIFASGYAQVQNGMSKITAKLHGKQSGARLRCILRGYFREGTNRQYDAEDYALSVVCSRQVVLCSRQVMLKHAS